MTVDQPTYFVGIVARRRQRELDQRNVLSFRKEMFADLEFGSPVVPADRVLNMIQSKKYHYASSTSSRQSDEVAVWSFVTVEEREIRAHPQRPSQKLLNVYSELSSEEMLRRKPWEAYCLKAIEILGRDFARPTPETDVLKDGDNVLEHPADSARRPSQPKIFAGGIATADTLLKRAATRDHLRDRYKVKAVEMESSGLQTAAWAHGKDIFVVRGICDYCDPQKKDDWQGYAALVAASYARVLIEAMPIEWF